MDHQVIRSGNGRITDNILSRRSLERDLAIMDDLAQGMTRQEVYAKYDVKKYTVTKAIQRAQQALEESGLSIAELLAALPEKPEGPSDDALWDYASEYSIEEAAKYFGVGVTYVRDAMKRYTAARFADKGAVLKAVHSLSLEKMAARSMQRAAELYEDPPPRVSMTTGKVATRRVRDENGIVIGEEEIPDLDAYLPHFSQALKATDKLMELWGTAEPKQSVNMSIRSGELKAEIMRLAAAMDSGTSLAELEAGDSGE